MAEKGYAWHFRPVLWLIRLFYRKMKVEGAQRLPEGPAIIVSNHTKMNGPVACELYFPRKRYTWCNHEMMHLREVPEYAYQDFWSRKPKAVRWFYWLLSRFIAPFSVYVFGNARTIPVYRDARILATFRESLERLQEGADIVIFPEMDAPYNHILCRFQRGFVDIARMYRRKTGAALPFVPMYIAPTLNKMVIGEPVYFCADNPPAQERERICEALAQEITRLAEGLPRHKVVPYNNVRKKNYAYNIPAEVKPNEKARG